MKSLLTFLALALTTAPVLCANATGPSLTVRDARGNPMPLHVEELSVQVRLVADIAETTVTIGFRNPGGRQLEGEFAMPLPAGATVSSYALEVNGAMRESVSVGKERARFAYESIKAQRIDPGFVEREEGNIYRTKIFPILPRSVKRVRIGYVETLPVAGGKLRYELPLETPGPVAEAACVIGHLEEEEVTAVRTAGLTMEAGPEGGLAGKATGATLRGRLIVEAPAPEPTELLMERGTDGLDYFYLRMAKEPGALKPRPKPRSIRLIWDASRSGTARDHERELEFLAGYLKEAGDCTVVLHFLRHDLSDGGSFPVRKGRWKELRKTLEAVVYDGGSRFDLLPLDGIEDDTMLLFTDGVAPLLPGAEPPDCPLFTIDAAPSRAHRAFAALATASGGAFLDLQALDPGEAVRQAVHEPTPLDPVAGAVIDYHLDDHRASGRFVRLHGRVRQGGGEWLHVGDRRFGPRIATRVPAGLVRRLWAQRELEAMEAAHPHREEDIVAHCKEHTLVSDYTSLIVLERFSDYVRYEIPPPEAELRQKWEREVARGAERSGWQQLISRWTAKREWHQRNFPWLDAVLLPRLTEVTIWLRAIEKIFAPDEVDAAAVTAIADWRREVLAVIDRRDGLRRQDDFENWQKDVGRLVGEGGELRERPVALPKEGRPMVVSVRGLVKNPGNIEGPRSLTLQKAIEEAGGYSPLGSATAVHLYRNGSKTVYNLLSARSEDVPLRPGDMVVVKEFNWAMWRWRRGEVLRSSAGGPPRYDSDPRSHPPVFLSDLSAAGGSDWESAGMDPFGDVDPFAADDGPPRTRRTESAMKGAIRIVAGKTMPRPDLKEFREALEGGQDGAAAYRELVASAPIPPDSAIEIAHLLFANGHPDLGERALSNLLETPELQVERVRACALWLAELGRLEPAIELLRALAASAPQEFLTPYELAHVTVRAGHREGARKMLTGMIVGTRSKDPVAAEIALTDLNGLVACGELPALPKDTPIPRGLRDNLDADVRVVVSTSHPGYQLAMEVQEPSGDACAEDSPTGGRLVKTSGLCEYMMRRALPGTYTLRCWSREPVTARVVLYRDWGRNNQERRELTIQLPGDDRMVTLATLEFAFPD